MRARLSNYEARSNKQFFTHALFVLIFLLLCRIIASYFIPLNDTTEARYAEIARKMLETGNWVTPQHDYGVPFWAKPPLSFWFSALSMKLFGVNEFAARLPELLLSMGIVWLIWDLAKKHSGMAAAMISVLVLSGTLYFFLDAGAVMTDPSLIFCTTLAMITFWRALVEGNSSASYVFFMALGLGLLAKGPIAIVLVALPIFFWVLFRNEWLNLWRKLPWIKGTLLTLAIALPWYVLAEIRTPGFLNYFILGEHVHRFLTPAWGGDKYGMAHDAYKGMIWVYAVVGIFPWCILGGRWLILNWRTMPRLCADKDGWMSYLLCCMLTPLIFFTFASNIIYPYVFPSLPFFALFFAEVWKRSQQSLTKSYWVFPLSSLCGLFFLIVTLAFAAWPEVVSKTQKPVVTAWKDQNPLKGTKLTYWNANTYFSAQFYSAGKVQATWNAEKLCHFLSNRKENYLVVNSVEMPQIPDKLASKLTLVKTVTIKSNTLLLFHSPVLVC